MALAKTFEVPELTFLTVKGGLLQAVQAEVHSDVRRKIAHDVAELATLEAVGGGW